MEIKLDLSEYLIDVILQSINRQIAVCNMEIENDEKWIKEIQNGEISRRCGVTIKECKNSLVIYTEHKKELSEIYNKLLEYKNKEIKND